MQRWASLRLQERAGIISDLKRQVRYEMTVRGVFVGYWKADFTYTVTRDGSKVVEDCKGFRTPVYKLKKRIVEAQYRIVIMET